MSHMQTMAHNDALYESDHPIPARSSADLAVSNPYTRQDQDPQTYALREAHALPTPSGPHSAFEAYVEGPGGVSLPSHRAYGPATTARNGTPPVAEQEGSPAPRRKSKLERSLEPSGYAAADTEGVQLDYADPTKTIRPHRGSPAGARAKVGPSRTSDDSTAGDAPSHLGRSGTEFLSRYNERNEAVLGSPRNGDGILHDLEAGVANRTAAALQEAKDRGLATPAMIEHATAAPGVNPCAPPPSSPRLAPASPHPLPALLLQVRRLRPLDPDPARLPTQDAHNPPRAGAWGVEPPPQRRPPHGPRAPLV